MKNLKWLFLLFAVFVFISNTYSQAKKRVLVEQVVDAKDGNTPEGLVKMAEVMANHGDNLVFINIHKSNDATLFTFEGNDIIASFTNTVPQAAVDSIKWPSTSVVGVSPSEYNAKISQRLTETAPVAITIGDIKINVDDVDIDITVEFTSNLSGDIRTICLFVEDKVSGTGADYDQANNYNSVMSHPFYGLGDPIPYFEHMRVVRDFVSNSAWGDFVFPDSMFPPHYYSTGAKVTKTFKEQLYFHENRNRMWIVAFVARYDANDVNNREVFNVVQKKLTTVSIEDDPYVSELSNIYPNPVGIYGGIEFTLKSQNDVALEIYDMLGKKVIETPIKSYSSGTHHLLFNSTELTAGSYLALIRIGDKTYTRKFIK